MQTQAAAPLVEAYLVVEQPRQRLGHWSTALAALDDRRAPPLASVAAYYDQSVDQAVLALSYDELALGAQRLTYVVEVALLAEIGMIQPAELSEGDRRRFVSERLARCAIHVANQRSVVGALTELVKLMRELKLAPKQVIGPLPPRPPAGPAATTKPRGTPDDPILLLQAKGTRNDLDAVTLVKGTRNDLDAIAQVARATSQNVIPREIETKVMTPDEFAKLIDRPATVPSDKRTQTISPAEMQRLTSEARAAHNERDTDDDKVTQPTQPAPARETKKLVAPLKEPKASGSGPHPPNAGQRPDTEPTMPVTETAQHGIIYARYLRSGRWVPIRIGALSLKGAALMAGALPRVNDHVDLALSFGGHRALVRGPVKKVSSIDEAALTGAASFSVSFELDDAARRQLTSLLTAARAANVTIKPPPPRAARRFPVEWPVCLGTTRGAIRAEALDVSLDGMFVRPVHALTLETRLNFSVILDDAEAPVSGRARVVRQVLDFEARTCGLTPGYGLAISDMAAADRDRWALFVARIERRADLRILVGAAPARLAELQAGLAAAGYVVSGGTDPNAFVQLAGAEARPVDAALVDAGWLTPNTPMTWVESLFAARNVPCVTHHGDAKRARITVDRLLAVA